MRPTIRKTGILKMKLAIKRDLSDSGFTCKAYKSSKFISGDKMRLSHIVLVVFGLRFDIKF